MKTFILISILTIAMATGFTNAQDVISTVTSKETKTITTETGEQRFTPVTHWSLGIKGGANYFRILPEPIKRIDQIHLMYGGTVEYTINPKVGIGLEYNYNPYGRPYYTDVTTGNLYGGTHNAILYGSLNFSNWLAPYRTGKNLKWNVYGNVGVGYSFYNITMDIEPVTYHQGPMANAGINVEHNISKSWAFGIEGQYRYYHRKFVNSRRKGDALTTTIGLRYKFNANGSKSHARNISMTDYYPKPPAVIIEKIVKENSIETLERLKALEAENAGLKDEINRLNGVILALTYQVDGSSTVAFTNIEFEFGSDKLTPSSYPVLNQIAVALIKKPGTITVNISGHTDYIGTDEFNQALSIKRSNAVKNYLLSKNVPDSGISISGYGEKKPIASNKTKEGRQKNRRVEFEITKQQNDVVNTKSISTLK